MDNIQKAGVVVVPAAIAIIAVILVGSFWSSASEFYGPTMSDITGERRAEFESWAQDFAMRASDWAGRAQSLGGQLDLDGNIAGERLQLWTELNIKLDEYSDLLTEDERDMAFESWSWLNPDY